MHIQEIKGFKFSTEKLKISLNDTVRYTIAPHPTSTYSSLYNQNNRFFILYIEEVNKESPPLFTDTIYEYKFIESGTYTVSCLNYPKLQQTIIVEEEGVVQNEGNFTCVDNLSEISQMESEISSSVNNQESLFMQSEENSNMMSLRKDNNYFQNDESTKILSFNNQKSSNFKNIGSCLELITKGVSTEAVMSKFPEIFDENNDEDEKTSNLKNKTTDDFSVLNDVNSMFDESAFAEVKAIGKSNENQLGFEKIYSVYKINKEKPDNLFKIFSRLKNELEVKTDKGGVYTAIDKMKEEELSGIDLESISPNFPKCYKSRKMRRALLQMEKRFLED